MPLLYVLAVLICLPSFYTSNCLFGSRLSFLQVAAVFASAAAVNAVLPAALAPVSLFFLVTSGSCEFHKLFNVFFCAVGGLCGIWYFVRAMRTAAEASGRRLRKGVMFIWLLLYAFVGTQLGSRSHLPFNQSGVILTLRVAKIMWGQVIFGGTDPCNQGIIHQQGDNSSAGKSKFFLERVKLAGDVS